MRITVQSGGLDENFGEFKAFEMIAQAGFEGVDLNLDNRTPAAQVKMGIKSEFYGQSIQDLERIADRYLAAAEKHGLVITQAHAPFPPRTGDEDMEAYVLDAIKKSIMMCGRMHCKYLVVHPGCLEYSKRTDPQEEWDWNIRMYTSLIPDLKKHGVICCLENMFSRHRGRIMEGPCATAREANRYIDTLNEIAGEKLFAFCLDTGHAVLVGNDLGQFVRELGDRLVALHVHDNDGLNDEHLIPYMGVTPWKRFLDALKETGYAHDLNFETFNAIETFDKALAPDVLKLAKATAELFRKKVTA